MQNSWSKMLILTRAAGGTFLVTALALLVPSQTRDMLANFKTFTGDGDVGPAVAFHLSLIVLCFSLWHWSRALLSAWYAGGQRGVAKKDPQRLIPRWLFIGGALTGIIAALKSGQILHALLILVWAWFFYWYLMNRPAVQKRLFGRESLTRGAANTPPPPRFLPSRLIPLWNRPQELLDYAPFGPRKAAAILVITLLLMLAGTVESFFPSLTLFQGFPLFFGRLLPGPAAALLFLGLTVGPLTVLTYTFDVRSFGKQSRIPHIPVLIIIAVVMGVTPQWINMHGVRILGEKSVLKPADRTTLARLFTEWVKVCAPDTSKPIRPIIVAASGGASRAGFWAARVLTKVDEAAALQNASIFAVSSVSGGSAGVAGYMSLRSVTPGCTLSPDTPDYIKARTPEQAAADAKRIEAQDNAIKAALQADALGPTLAGALFGDLPRALLGLPVFVVRYGYYLATGTDYELRGGDRAEALEQAFEENWHVQQKNLTQAGIKETDFANGFLALNYQGKDAPRKDMTLWLANGTDSQNGERIITAPFEINGEAVRGAGKARAWIDVAHVSNNERYWAAPFPGALDALSLLKSDIPVSTTITNTARFPFLSPAGELTPYAGVSPQRPDYKHELWEAWQLLLRGANGILGLVGFSLPTDNASYSAQVVDGGYFENGGLQTAMDLARWLKQYGGPLVNNRPIDPILILATADAGETADDDDKRNHDIVRCRDGFIDHPDLSRGHARPFQAMAPLEGLYSTRDGHAAVVLREARLEFCGEAAKDDRFFHFYLYKPKDRDVPLNWVLPDEIADYIWDGESKDHPPGAMASIPNKREFSNLEKALTPP